MAEEENEADKLDVQAMRHMMHGENAQAELLLRQALAWREATFGAEHPAVAGSLCNIAECLQAQGKGEQAQLLYEQALRLLEHAYPEGHVLITRPLVKLGSIYWHQGQTDRAEANLKRALTIRQKQLGADHFQVAAVERLLAKFYQAQGRADEAVTLMAQAQQTTGNLMAPVFAVAAQSMKQMSQRLEASPTPDAQGSTTLTTAESYIQRSIEMTRNLVGPDNPAIADLLENQAVMLRRLKREKEAEEKEAQAQEIRAKLSHG